MAGPFSRREFEFLNKDFQFETPWFSRQKPAKKNSEIFGILQSHNMLPERYLQKNDKPSIYRNAENSENFNVLQSHNLLSEGACENRWNYY
jgi:hypothetical protein